MNKKILAIIFALLAAFLYAINIPLSKKLLENVSPTMLASYLYLGAGIGISILKVFTKKEEEKHLEKSDLVYVLGMIILDILAPILLMFGLKGINSSSASLLNNFEIVATSIIALFIFKEAISWKLWIAIILITISSFVLSIEDISEVRFSLNSLLVLLATIAWGFENNCTKKISNKSTYEIVALKGIFSGLGSMIVAIIIGESFASVKEIGLTLILGFVAYGLSIFTYIKAQNIIGASKTSAYYAINPFIGALLSFIFLKEKISYNYIIALLIMVLGTAFVISDTLKEEKD